LRKGKERKGCRDGKRKRCRDEKGERILKDEVRGGWMGG